MISRWIHYSQLRNLPVNDDETVQDYADELRSWGIDTGRLSELMGEMKVPVVSVREKKQHLLREAAS